MSTRMFTAFLLLALFNILSEFLALYTLGNVDTVNPAVNRFCHQLFIGSLDAIALFMFLYIDMKARRQKRYSPVELAARCLPALAAFLMVLLNGEILRSIYGYSGFFAMLQEKAEHIIGNEGNRFCFNESIISTVFTKKEAYQSWRQSWKEKADIAEVYGINPPFFNLEITETATVQAGERLTSNMEKLRRAGCHFSMDDFGTGYSNLSHIGKSNF